MKTMHIIFSVKPSSNTRLISNYYYQITFLIVPMNQLWNALYKLKILRSISVSLIYNNGAVPIKKGRFRFRCHLKEPLRLDRKEYDKRTHALLECAQ